MEASIFTNERYNDHPCRCNFHINKVVSDSTIINSYPQLQPSERYALRKIALREGYIKSTIDLFPFARDALYRMQTRLPYPTIIHDKMVLHVACEVDQYIEMRGFHLDYLGFQIVNKIAMDTLAASAAYIVHEPNFHHSASNSKLIPYKHFKYSNYHLLALELFSSS